VEDADALAAAIRRLVDEPGLSERLAAGGRAAWQAGYTEEIVTGRYRALFERLAG
jgi:glycosyltransferase involved in cell wall biosynthesis